MQFDMKVIGAEKLKRGLRKETVTEPLGEGIKKATLWLERIVKQSTPSGESSRLRGGVTSQVSGEAGKVGTNIEYARFVEYGHKQEVGRFVPAIGKRLVAPWVEPSRVGRGGTLRIRDKGAFTYGFEQLQGKIKDFLGDIGKAIQVRFG